MAVLPSNVRPGDLISADLINAILDELRGTTSQGTEVVPNVFGTFLSEARAIILSPARQLALGFTYDVSGAAIDPNVPSNFNLIVLNQSPAAETRVPAGTTINLVVSGATSSTSPANPPTITRTETSTGTVTTSFPVNGTLVIVGNNFSPTASQNQVTFDNVPAASVVNDPADPTRRLQVVVPTGIPGGPTNPGDPAKPGVVLRVAVTGSSTPVTSSITVTAPVAGQPTITSVSPSSPFELTNVTITGTNFTSTTQVLIRDVPAAIVSFTATQIVATVPDFPDILPGPPIPASLKVVVPTVGDATFTGTFRVRGV